MTSRVTLGEVADAAGVSVPTVSKVLNGHRDVAAETRSRVEATVERLGYVRTRAKQRPRRRAALLDLVINELDSSWATEILAGTEEVAHETGMNLVLTAVHSRATPSRQWLESLTSRGTQGIL